MDVNFEIEKLDSLIEQILISKLFESYKCNDQAIVTVHRQTQKLISVRASLEEKFLPKPTETPAIVTVNKTEAADGNKLIFRDRTSKT